MTRSILWFFVFLVANSNIPKGHCREWLIEADGPVDQVEDQSGSSKNEGQSLCTQIKEKRGDENHQLLPRSGRSTGLPWSLPPSSRWSALSKQMPAGWVTADGDIDTSEVAKSGLRAMTTIGNWGRGRLTDYLHWLQERRIREQRERELMRAISEEFERSPSTASPPQDRKRGRSWSSAKEPPRTSSAPLQRQHVSVARKKLRDSEDPDSQKLLMKCLAEAVAKVPMKQLAVTSASSVLTLIPVVGEHFTPTPEIANPDVARVVRKFVEEAMPCFGYFNRDPDGNLQFDPKVAMRGVSNAVKQSQNLNLAVAQALVENVKVTYDLVGRPKYDINYPGLGTSLGMAYAKSTTIGRVTSSLAAGGSSLSRMLSKVGTNDSNEEPLIECLKRALLSAPIQALALSSAKEVASSIPFLGGFFGSTPESSAVKPTDLVHSFVDAALPCFIYFKKDKSGKFMFDQEYAVSSALQIAKQHPDLPHAVAEALAKSVREIPPNTDGEKPQFDIDYNGLTEALKTAVAVSSRDKIEHMLENFYGKDNGVDLDDPKENLITCLIKAVGKVQLSRIVISSATSLICSFWGDTRSAGRSREASKIVQSFVDAAKPCFDFYTHDEDGNLVFDSEYAKASAVEAAVEAARWNPLTSLILGVAEAIKKNVKMADTEDENVEWEVNKDGLTIDLGKACLRSTKIGCITSRFFGFP